jgi:hypothetical protein
MLVGAYSPNAVTSQVLLDWSFFPVRNGTSRFEKTTDGKRAIGTVNGQDVVVAEIKSSNEPSIASIQKEESIMASLPNERMSHYGAIVKLTRYMI